MRRGSMQENMTRRASLPYPASMTSTSVPFSDGLRCKTRRSNQVRDDKLDEKRQRGRVSSAFRAKQQTPSYIPSYIQPLSETVRSEKPSSGAAGNILRRSTGSYARRHTVDSSYLTTSTYGGSETSPVTKQPSEWQLTRKKSSLKVKDAIAAMEARITETVPLRSASKAQLTAEKKQTSPDSFSNIKARHRRSMSDPYLQKTFSEVKKLWDTKVETEKKSRRSESTTSSSGSISSTEANKSPALKNRPVEHKQPRAAAEVHPSAPPRIKTNVRRSRDSPKTANFSEKPTSVKQVKKMSNSTVSARAALFGGTGKPAFPRQHGAKSPAFSRHQRSCSDESLEKTLSSGMESTDVTHIYDEVCVCTDSDLAENQRLMDNLKSKADHAREKRWNKRGSCDSSATSDDDDSRRRGSLLENVRRGSHGKDVSAKRPSLSQQSPVKSEAIIFGVESSQEEVAGDSVMSSSSPSSPTPRDKRRTSSLHKLIEYKRAASYNTSNAQLPPDKTPLAPVSPEADASEQIHRPTTLQLLHRERSRTEGEADHGETKNSTDYARSNTLDRAGLKSPTPAAKATPPPVLTKPIRPRKIREQTATREGPVTGGEAASETSTDSLGTLSNRTSVSGEFNLVEEYEKIAQEVNNESGLGSTSPASPSNSDQKQLGTRHSLEVPSRPGSLKRGPNADCWSDFDNSDECDEDSFAGTPRKSRSDSSAIPSPSASFKEPNEVKLHNIAKELLSTEESYVAVLHLIDQVFHKRVMEAATQRHIIAESVVGNIFCHIPAIYQFHSSFLLPQLQDRLKDWENNPRIGDIMAKAAPFLKMYSLYVQHFDEAMNTIKSNQEKNSAFDTLIKSIEKLPECNFLTLQHHMLGPVQRVPRYRLLLEDYVKRLPEDSDERPVAGKALQLITVAATHSNETMKKIEKFHKLVNVFNRLADINFDIVDVSRELLKEGKIIKISARNGEKYERYLYLFSDMLLCCSPLGRLQGKSYRVTAKIDLDGMQITDAKNPTAQNSFCVEGKQKSMEFATGTQEEKEVWVEAIKRAISDYMDRMETFRKQATLKTPVEPSAPFDCSLTNGQVNSSPAHSAPVNANQLIDIADAELGTRAPRWIKDHEVTMCMCCSKTFNKLIRRRHHCRACGRVVCSECSEHKTVLQYEPDKAQKVCSRCFKVLTGQQHRNEVTDGEKKGVLEVEADTFAENSVIADYLFFTEHVKKKAWTKTWCVIPKNELCLYFYGAHQDVRAQMTMPLPGYEVTTTTNNDHKFSFKLSQARKILFFATDDQSVLERWIYALKKASTGEDLTREDVYSLGRNIATDTVQETEGDASSFDSSSDEEESQ